MRFLYSLNSFLCASAVFVGLTPFGLDAHAQDVDESPLSDYVSQTDPPTFDTPEAAIEAFKKVASGGNFDDLADLVGLDAAKAKAGEEVMETYAEIGAGLKQKLSVVDVAGRKILEIGDDMWPFPFPVERTEGGKWTFATYVGLEEIANRIVGENELQTVATMRQYTDAQEEYASADRDGDGVLEYAQRLISSEGQMDGLYWPTEEGEAEDSPGGEALADADVLANAKDGDGYNGYHYRILTRQGDNIAGGKFDYVVNGNMIAGFGLVAWPIAYGVSGVNTFVVDKNGIVYEADLGEETKTIASGIRQFNPSDDWHVVND